MSRHKDPSPTQVLLGAALVIAVLLAIGLPAAMTYDSRVDRDRPLYEDLASLRALEFAELKQHGEAVAVALESGEHQAVGNTRYAPSRGSSVEARTTQDGFCLRGSNEHGLSTAWECYTADDAPTAR